MKKQTMIVGVVLDESGSMDSCRAAAITGTNEYIRSLKKDREEHPELGEVYITLVKFSSGGAGWSRSISNRENIRFIYNTTDIREVEELTAADYNPKGGTPYLEALGRTIEAVEEFLGKVAPNTKPETEEGQMPSALANFLGGNESVEEDETEYKIVIVTQTDGDENSSSDAYKPKSKIEKMIAEREARGNWTFVFLGADMSKVSDGMTMSAMRGNNLSYAKTERATEAVYAAAGTVTNSLRHNIGTRSIANFAEEMKMHVSADHLTSEENNVGNAYDKMANDPNVAEALKKLKEAELSRRGK